jgi:hypothetical protein
VIFLIGEDAVHVGLGHSTNLLVDRSPCFLHSIYFVLKADNGEDFLKPARPELDCLNESPDLLIRDLTGHVAALGRARLNASRFMMLTVIASAALIGLRPHGHAAVSAPDESIEHVFPLGSGLSGLG